MSVGGFGGEEELCLGFTCLSGARRIRDTAVESRPSAFANACSVCALSDCPLDRAILLASSDRASPPRILTNAVTAVAFAVAVAWNLTLQRVVGRTRPAMRSVYDDQEQGAHEQSGDHAHGLSFADLYSKPAGRNSFKFP